MNNSDKYRKQGIKDAFFLLFVFPLGFISLVYIGASSDSLTSKIGIILFWAFISLFATFGLVGTWNEEPSKIRIKDQSPILQLRKNKYLKWSIFLLLIAIQSIILATSYSNSRSIPGIAQFILLLVAILSALLFIKRK